MKKKLIIAIIAAIVVLGGGIGGYVYHSNQVKAENAAICKSKAKDIRMSSIRLIYGLKFITADFITNWNSSIENEVAINMSNKIVSCDDYLCNISDSFFHISDSEGETWDNFDIVEQELK